MTSRKGRKKPERLQPEKEGGEAVFGNTISQSNTDI
jgi:hypothetical protein